MSGNRAGSASFHTLVDYAVAHPTFTVREVQRELGISNRRANGLVESLVDLNILNPLSNQTYNRRFLAPSVLEVLIRPPNTGRQAELGSTGT